MAKSTKRNLLKSAKVVVGPDLSFESQAPNLRYLDTFGHGTAMSSIIAGREVAQSTGATYAADTTNFIGMAPDARIVSVKLGDHNGTVDVSQLIAGIDWVTANEVIDPSAFFSRDWRLTANGEPVQIEP